MTFYDAFCGIGGFRLGLERVGWRCVGSCEIDETARVIYHARFGSSPERDIRKVTSINEADLLCGGFPCQDVSVAGSKTGISGERSGLWKEMHRLIETCRPPWVIVENVTGLLVRGFNTVLSDLAQSGYDAEWDCLPASAFGSPQQRDRLWIVAYHNSERIREEQKGEQWNQTGVRPISKDFWTETKPPILGVDDGFPAKAYRCLGNAVVPQVVEWIVRRINQING